MRIIACRCRGVIGVVPIPGRRVGAGEGMRAWRSWVEHASYDVSAVLSMHILLVNALQNVPSTMLRPDCVVEVMGDATWDARRVPKTTLAAMTTTTNTTTTTTATNRSTSRTTREVTGGATSTGDRHPLCLPGAKPCRGRVLGTSSTCAQDQHC